MASQFSVTTRSLSSIPIFLAPAFSTCRTATHPSAGRFFSSSCRNEKRKERRREMNKQRGVSAIRSTGPRVPLSVTYKYPDLPTPRPENERPLKEFPTSKDHGLYGFFNENRATVLPGEDEEAHGRSWTYSELMSKSFDDLHALYWTGLKEINRIATRKLEHSRLKLGFGGIENEERMAVVRKTNENIRKVLRDRQYLYDEARLLVLNKKLEEVIGAEETLESDDFVEDSVVSASSNIGEPAKSAPSEDSKQVR